MSKTYHINDIFGSIQGEGTRAGTVNLFLRFAVCNLRCAVDNPEPNAQFDCDTEWLSSVAMTAEDILARFHELLPKCCWIICTGGEPALQLDTPLVETLHAAGYRIAIETNGSKNIDPLGLDFVCVSPKVAEHAIRQRTANEVRYVRNYGQGIPQTTVEAEHYLISPAFNGEHLDPRTLQWCIDLCKEHPKWRLSLQLHKFLKVL